MKVVFENDIDQKCNERVRGYNPANKQITFTSVMMADMKVMLEEMKQGIGT